MGASLLLLVLSTYLCVLLNQINGVAAFVSRSSLTKRALDPEWAFSADPAVFHRRAFHSTVVVDNHLYIDGGEVYYVNNGSAPKPLPLNSTYSIDLSASWTNDSVVLHQIDKTSAPRSLNAGNTFSDPSGTSFYQWNGKISSALPYDQLPDPPSASLWQFRTDGDLGKWSLVTAPNLKRLARSASTQGNGTAYFLGGFGDWRSDKDYYSNTSLRFSGGGLVTYEIQSQTWANSSIEELAPSGWSFDASFHYLQGMGREGLLLAMGGATSPPGGTNRQGDEILNPFNYVTLYDAMAKKWYNQSTSGDIPVKRYSTCSVGIAGDNGTFEIFLYGGSVTGSATATEEQQTNLDFAEIYVLSIPSFRWHKTDLKPATSRFRHTCNVAGQRQMIVTGGLAAISLSKQPTDPWRQGLGIFDLTTLQWKSSYDPSAEPYQSPRMIKESIANDGQYPSSWDSPTVEGWFTNKAVDNNPSSSPGTATSGKSSNTGAIVGGVIGGVVALALIGLAVFFLRRRSRKPQAEQQMLVEQSKMDDEPSPTKRAELNSEPDDLHNHGESWEMDAGTTHRFELPASEGQKLSKFQGGVVKNG